MNTRYSGKRYRNIQVNTKHNTRKKIGPVGAFFITLGCVLFVGGTTVVMMALPKYLRMHANEDISIITFVEAIPQTLQAEEIDPEVLGSNAVKERYADTLADPELMKANRIVSRSAANKDIVTLGFVGDILFDDEYAVMATLKQRGGDITQSISPDTLSIMQSMDVMVVNNEFPYTERGSRTPEKQYTFRADYDTAFYLNQMGADAAILANNHVLDFGPEGLNDTLDTLANVGVEAIGAGRNIEEASHPVYFIVNDIKIAIVAATQIERNDSPNTIGATETSGGTFRCWSGDLIYQKIAEAKANSDFVVVCVHWGTEKETSPDCWQLKQAPLLAQAGADLIIGDHPHVLQGFTYYENTPCIFSLGNFWFNSSTLDTGMVVASIDKNGLKSLRFLPAVQKNMTTGLVTGDESSRILSSMRNLSTGVVIDENGFVHKK